MKFSSSIAVAALLATASATPAGAAQRRANRQRRLAQRSTKTADFHTNPFYPGAKHESNLNITNAGPGGWAGGVMAGQNGVTQVQATVTVPTPSIPPNGDSSGNTQYGGSAWIGIDGYGTDTLWQTGVTWTIQGSQASFSGWYEWFPAGEVPFQGFNVNPGDTISLNLIATSTASGTAYITNESTGQSVQQTMTGQPALVQQTAEWIVEDFGIGSGSIPFAAFSPVTFDSCEYTDSSGQGQGLNNPTIVNVNSNGNAFTSCSSSGSSVSCSYVGNAANS